MSEETVPPTELHLQTEEALTTAGGVRLRDTDHSLKAGERGPSLLQDHHLREKITHFDHERIPERVVHARGAAAHGHFVGYGTASSLTCAEFLGKDVVTPVFVRFSTVLGSRGSADTVRDTRGFATKFYTAQGTFDLVGNNMPVFFIQDGIKFPDIIHAAKPQPDREIPQAQSAHDTFWDFVSLHTEAQHHALWNMSDRGLPRSYRMMEGFGVHTFRLVDADGATTLAKFHWKPRLGVHGLLWEEAQLLAGFDPDFHRRDLAAAIDAGTFPEWELGVQVFPDSADQTFEGIDLLDPTKLVPEELAPVQPLGRMVLDRNPANYFAETEQVAFHVGHLVPGIDVTDDALMQARLFSYVDTQLTRLGGPNFEQIPINRPHAPVNDLLRDGMHQSGVHTGIAPYLPNSVGGGCPFAAPGAAPAGAFVDVARNLPSAPKVRAASVSFDDHFSQARLFWLSLSPLEQDHVVAAYAFELGKCTVPEVVERQVACLAQIDSVLCAQVATRLGVDTPDATPPVDEVEPSPALSMLGRTWPVDGRVVGVVVDQSDPAPGIDELCTALQERSMIPLLIGPTGVPLPDGTAVMRRLDTLRSVELDALVIAPGTAALAADPLLATLLAECFRHGKVIATWDDGSLPLRAAGIDPAAAGVALGTGPEVADDLSELLTVHRAWDRLMG